MNNASEQFPDNWRMIAYFLKGSVRYFASGAVCAVLVALFDLLSPQLISFTVDSLIGSEEPVLPAAVSAMLEACGGLAFLRANLWMAALAAALLGAAAALFRYLFRSLNARGAETFVCRIRDELFIHILHLPYAWHGENSTGDILQRCTSDVQTIKRFVAEQLTSLLRTLLLIVLSLFFMFRLHVKIALASAAFIPVIVGASFAFHFKMRSAFEKVDTEEGVLSAIAQENLTGVRVVRAFGREAYEMERFNAQNTAYTALWVRLIRILSAYWATGDLVTGLQVMTVLALGAAACVRGTLTAGGFIAMLSYNTMLVWPVRSLGRVISEMSKAGIAIERLRYIMNAPVEADAKDAVTPDLAADIVFDHVSFSYGNETPDILRDVSFTVPAGSTLGILGSTGSGKSTLMYLLTRLYDLPEGKGRITIGGTDIRKIPRAYLRAGVGIVLQEPYLLSRTLTDNIRLAVPQADLHAVHRAAREAGIDDTIESFTHGYDTFVGERGVTLSGGQKQRTAIAQMLIRGVKVMIFDDSLSAVDTETDAKIRKEIRTHTGQATMILIAHRITTLMDADVILVMDKGRIREAGTHEALLAEGGLYKKIYDLQTAGAMDGGETDA